MCLYLYVHVGVNRKPVKSLLMRCKAKLKKPNKHIFYIVLTMVRGSCHSRHCSIQHWDPEAQFNSCDRSVSSNLDQDYSKWSGGLRLQRERGWTGMEVCSNPAKDFEYQPINPGLSLHCRQQIERRTLLLVICATGQQYFVLKEVYLKWRIWSLSQI